jgi:integral membrane protein (TIGR01906 family)
VSKFFDNVLRWLIVLALPPFLTLTTARLMVADWYPRSEYAKADFPRDRYGFTQQKRLDLALVAIHYLNRSEPAEQVISMLREQRLPGTDQPLYNTFEIGHMVDVKRVMDTLWRIQVVSVVVVAGGLAVLLMRGRSRTIGFNALFGGGVLTTILLLGLSLFVLTAWNTFFVEFHEVLFPPGSWTFDWSDSLIRLFPDKFWSDAGTIIVLATLVEGMAATVAGYLLSRWWTRRADERRLGAMVPATRQVG